MGPSVALQIQLLKPHIRFVVFLLLFSVPGRGETEFTQKTVLEFLQSATSNRASKPDDVTRVFSNKRKALPVRRDSMKNAGRVLAKGAMTLGFVGLFAVLRRSSSLVSGSSGKSQNRKRRKTTAFILLGVTIIVVVGLLMAGATGEGGFIWIIVIPILMLMWLIFLIAGWRKNSKSKAAESNE